MPHQMTLVEFGHYLESKGYDCAEHPQFGGVAPGAHSANSWHYGAKGETVGALDINVPPPGDHQQEREMLEALWEALVPVVKSLEELIYKGRGYFDGHRGNNWGNYGHQTHLHIAASKPIVGFREIGGRGPGLLRKGATGPDVGRWQRQLRRHDPKALPEFGVDHDFGDETIEYTKRLQRHAGVRQDGVVGPNTRRAYRQHMSQSGHPHGQRAPGPKRGADKNEAGGEKNGGSQPSLKRPAEGDAVKRLQRALQRHGCDPGAVDGIFGQGTLAAVQRFQRARGLKVDGIVGPRTWAELATAPTPARDGTHRDQRLSEAGRDFIADFEGFRSELYDDPAGHCTAGFGHLVHHGHCDGSEPAEFKQGISRRRALDLLADDARGAADAVNDAVKVELNQPQFDALVSFTFNLGAGNLRSSTLLRKLNAGDYEAVPSELKRWNRAGGQVLAGLTRRRKAEGRLFSSGKYT